MPQPGQLRRQLLIGLHQIGDLRGQRRDPRIPLRDERDQLLARHLFRHGHPKIKLRPGNPSPDQHAEIIKFLSSRHLRGIRLGETTGPSPGHLDAATSAASSIRQLSYPRTSSTRTSSRPARLSRQAAASTTSRDSDVSRIRPNGVTYGVVRVPSDMPTRLFDALAAITPNTYL